MGAYKAPGDFETALGVVNQPLCSNPTDIFK